MTPIETTRAALDERTLLEQVADDPELLLRVVEMFNADSRRILARLVEGFGRRDAVEVQKCAHFLKGALLTVGAGPAADVASRLEEMGAAGDLEDVAATLSALRSELRRVEEALGALTAGATRA
jgi:HPt (histidine-containing phosphotransfer) domain-containing protein